MRRPLGDYIWLLGYLRIYLRREYGIDINDDAFLQSNTVFENYLKELKRDGLGTTVHHKDISSDDLKRIFNTLSTETPVQLQYLLFVHLMIHFAYRGEENVDKLRKDDFIIVSLPDGRKYLKKNKDYATKNHQKGSESSGDAKIYSIGHPKDAINVFEKYVSKLHVDNLFLWQQPRNDFSYSDTHWYMNRKCGHNSIGDFMKKISKICNLSMTYTNHCLRATTCTILGDYFSDTDVQSISGHKSVNSLAIYKRPREQKQEMMSNTLSREMGLMEPSCSVKESEDVDIIPQKERKIEINNYGTIYITK